MEDQQEFTDELIAKYLTNEASDGEKEMFNILVSQSDINKKYFADIKTIYELTGNFFYDNNSIDLKNAWDKFHKQLNTLKVQKPTIRKIALSFYSKAAGILLIGGLSYFLYSRFDHVEKDNTLTSPISYILNDTLPDGTFISLDKKSTISYPPSFNKLDREVKLTGRAYFHVHHNPTLPFIVHVGCVFIKDIGTSFNIQANSSDSIISVSVEEGKVFFYSVQKPGITLLVNETGIYNKAYNSFRKKEELPSEDQSTGKTLVFKSMNLQSIVDTLNKTYKVNIVLACPKLKGLQLTSTFNEKTVNPIVETIAETLDLSITKTSGTILLDGDLCKN